MFDMRPLHNIQFCPISAPACACSHLSAVQAALAGAGRLELEQNWTFCKDLDILYTCIIP